MSVQVCAHDRDKGAHRVLVAHHKGSGPAQPCCPGAPYGLRKLQLWRLSTRHINTVSQASEKGCFFGQSAVRCCMSSDCMGPERRDGILGGHWLYLSSFWLAFMLSCH